MNTLADKIQENKRQWVANENSQKQSGSESTFQFVDNRPKTVAQRKLLEMVNDGPQTKKRTQLQAMADNYSAQQQLPILKKVSPEPSRRENKTGLPDNSKIGMENLSGMSLDVVKAHRNSDKPAQLQAHAYAQGSDIHLGPGQEKHLPHEAWQVLRQKQGRVKPTTQMKGGVNINDDVGLEKDIMSTKSIQLTGANIAGTMKSQSSLYRTIQRMRQDEVPKLVAVANHIRQAYDGFTIVGMGGSPAPIIAYLRSQNIPAFNIPLSIKGFTEDLTGDQQTQLRNMMAASVQGLNEIDNIVLIDVAGTGGSIAHGVRLIQAAYPDKTIRGAAIKENDDTPNNELYVEKVEAGEIRVVSPNNIENVDVSNFVGKLIGSGYKQYRAVGVFKPQSGDSWEQYVADEAGIEGENDFDKNSRARYNQLVDYLQDAENYTENGIGHQAYETNLYLMNEQHPRIAHKNAEDAKANERIAQIQQQIQQLAMEQQNDNT